MGHGQKQGVQVAEILKLAQLDAVFLAGFLGIGFCVMHKAGDIVLRKLIKNVHHFGVAQIRNVFLKGQAQNAHPRAHHGPPRFGQLFHRHLGDKFAHVVVNAAPGEDYFGVVAHAFSLIGQVVGVNADAMPAHKAGSEGQKVPLGPGCGQNGMGVNAQGLENNGQFVHERDIKVALGVFNNLGRFRHLDGRRFVDARRDHGAVKFG